MKCGTNGILDFLETIKAESVFDQTISEGAVRAECPDSLGLVEIPTVVSAKIAGHLR